VLFESVYRFRKKEILTHSYEGHGTTGNSSLILDLSIDLKKSIGWPGAFFCVEFLQFYL